MRGPMRDSSAAFGTALWGGAKGKFAREAPFLV